MARGRARDRTRRRPEPSPCGGVVRPPPSTGRAGQRDGAEQRPPPAQGDPRAQHARPPARPDHHPQPHPRDHPRADADRPRRQRQPSPARPCDRGRGVPQPAGHPLTARRERRPAGRSIDPGPDGARDTAHPQRPRGRVRRPLQPLRAATPADQSTTPRLRNRRLLAGARARRRARQLAPPRHASRVRARQGAGRGVAGAPDHHTALHVPTGHQAARLGRRQAQPVIRATFSRWIFFIAPFRRASGSGASEPRSTSARR